MSTEATPQRRRQCGPKTKTGCHTCKIRRVKCGEERPECLRCTKTGRKCDGYSQDIAASKSDDRQAVAIIQRLTIHAPGNARERRAFQYFATQTAVELTGYYETADFWQQLILQASSVDSALRHAVIAIGSLHEEFANNRLSYYTGQSARGVEFAVNQYSKAIGHLRNSLSSGKHGPMMALMSCILFVCFDSLRGHFDSAMVHLQSGLKILRDISARCPDESHMIISQIVPLFKRLSLQAILYIDTRSTPERRVFVASLADISFREEEIPEVFESLSQARHCLNQSVDGLFRGFYICDGDLPLCEQPVEALEMNRKYFAQIISWNNAYEKFMGLNSHKLSGKELRGAALLKIHHATASIMGRMIPDITDPRGIGEVMNDQSAFRSFHNDFKIITDLSRTLITAAEIDIKNGLRSLTFSTDLGLIGPLYYVCLRSQDQSIRQQALDLLTRCPRREGMWDSEAGAKMVMEFWEIEERHRMMQAATVTELGMEVSLNDVVDLVFDNEMKWEWKWKSPMSSEASESSRASSVSRSDSPAVDWFHPREKKAAWLL